ncbi:hypothetical protein F441_01196 [Phytophthora nicotianae CJ01A1]|uniref:Uncharacterized protein n=3 Tax=Phytophthora nicotianae TaxID=4792 RepID=W2Y0R4_PHYNI|nr:hypothetical protein L917_18966 [Phytophthora nicotianae]ETP25986.1 hypothetical protein F441_01196 [Phytophthora nicotianae CJ01A1]ETP28213.1 hypothetical protein F442_22501 [Phytophthora nicotianae P10297]
MATLSVGDATRWGTVELRVGAAEPRALIVVKKDTPAWSARNLTSSLVGPTARVNSALATPVIVTVNNVPGGLVSSATRRVTKSQNARCVLCSSNTSRNNPREAALTKGKRRPNNAGGEKKGKGASLLPLV